MSSGKKVKIIIGGIVGIALLFFMVLIIHIGVMVNNREPIANATIQMARADFNVSLDSASVLLIQDNIKELEGVRSTYFNYDSDILIYTFDNRVNRAQNIYDKAIRDSGFPSERITVSAEEAMQGCPAMSNNSFYGKLTRLVAQVIN